MINSAIAVAAKRGVVLTLLILVLFGAGCAMHTPGSTEPPPGLPDSFVGAKGPEATGDELAKSAGRWWVSFGDERLNSLIDEAFAANIELKGALARLEQAVEISRSSKARRWPAINVNADARRSKQPDGFGSFGSTGAGGFTSSETTDTYSYSLAASYELDLWSRIGSEASAANLSALATAEDVKALYLSLSAETAELYYLAAELRMQLELNDEVVASFTEMHERVERRYREGLVPALDLYQARQNLATVKANTPLLRARLAETEHALSQLLGKYPTREIVGNLAELPEASVAFKAGLPSSLLKNRPDIEAALLRLKASDKRVATAVAERFPSINLMADYGHTTTALASGDISGIFWNAIAGLTMPVFDFGRRKAEAKRAEAAFDETLANYHGVVLNAFREVEDALVRNRASEERITHLKAQLDAAEGALRLSIENYLQGLSDYLPVLTAQNLYYETKSSLITAKRELISNRIGLARALGGRWMDNELSMRQ